MMIYICQTINKQNHSKMSTSKLTVREIRTVLFNNDFHAVVGSEEMSNKEARDFFYAKENQEETFNVIENKDHLLVWN